MDSIDLSDRRTQYMIGGVGVGLVALIAVMRKGKGEPTVRATPSYGVDADTWGSIQLPDGPGKIGVVGPGEPIPGPQGPPGTPAKAPQSSNPFRVFRKDRNKWVGIAAAPTDPKAPNCAAGYVAAKNPNGTWRCTIIDDRLRKGTMPQTYAPGAKNAPKAGDASPVHSLDEMFGKAGDGAGHSPYGKVGGFIPMPAPIAAPGDITVRSGDTLRTLAARAYGMGEYWPRLYGLNRQRGMLTVGDRLKT